MNICHRKEEEEEKQQDKKEDEEEGEGDDDYVSPICVTWSARLLQFKASTGLDWYSSHLITPCVQPRNMYICIDSQSGLGYQMCVSHYIKQPASFPWKTRTTYIALAWQLPG